MSETDDARAEALRMLQLEIDASQTRLRQLAQWFQSVVPDVRAMAQREWPAAAAKELELRDRAAEVLR